MKPIRLLYGLVLRITLPILTLNPFLVRFANSQSSASSPAQDQVFQFMQSGSHIWSDGKTSNATAYLWIPEKCRRLRGLIVMGTNVPEQMLASDHEIRSMAARNDLGIVWTSPTVMYFQSKNENEAVVHFLQELLDGLARSSGYDEVATVPWIPIGESGHLLFVDALVEAAPQRCIAGIWLKNPHLPPHNRAVPALVILGTAQEWSQDKSDIRVHWQDVSFYDHVLEERAQHPDWPLTVVIDGRSGHFDMSRRLITLVAHYIDQITKLRRPAAASERDPGFSLGTGYLADLPVPKHQRSPITSYAATPADHLALPWYPDLWLAREAQQIADINWQADTQIPEFLDGEGTEIPFDFNGISSIMPHMEADGITFTLHSRILTRIPANFAFAGEPLADAHHAPQIEWLSGAVRPVGQDRFRVTLDRSYPRQAIYLDSRATGSESIRESVQPIAVKLQRNKEGQAQTISFAPLKDTKARVGSIQLTATSTSGLPVEFFVVAGPAYVQANRLIFTPIPPRTSQAVTVTVTAWQWGRASEPKIKEANVVSQSFHLLR